MFAAQKLAGYSAGNADLLRRAMGKKKKEILDKEYEPFAAGMKANGYSDAAIKTIWDMMVPFSGYAFNKAHAAGYALISYWTAYLKANFPAEYMAGLLTSVAGDKDKSALYLSECRRMGIKVLPPDVNASTAIFTPVGDDIRFGMAAVRNVGTAVVESIVAARTSKGAFTSFSDFLRKVPVNVCNKRVIESLIKAGAFDSFGHPRRGLLLIHEQAIDAVIDVKRNEAIGQDSLFGDDTHEAADLRRAGAGRRVGEVRRCWRSSGRCSGCTCPTTRCSASSTCWRPRPTARSRSCSARPTTRRTAAHAVDRGDAQVVTRRRDPVRRASARSPGRAAPGRRRRWRTSRARSRCCSSRRPTSPCMTPDHRRRDRAGQGAPGPARGRAEAGRDGGEHA